MRKFESFKYFGGSMVLCCVMAAWSATTQHGDLQTRAFGRSTLANMSALALPASNPQSAGGGGNDDSTGDTPQETRSGSRLAANYYTGDDGSQQFAYFTDRSMSSMPCRFAAASDNTTRCLPSTGAKATDLFSDSNCSSPLAVADSSVCPVPQYAAQVLASSCGAERTRIYPIHGVYTGPLYALQASATGGANCAVLPTPYAPAIYTTAGEGTFVVLSLGPEIPSTTFQQAIVQAL